MDYRIMLEQDDRGLWDVEIQAVESSRVVFYAEGYRHVWDAMQDAASHLSGVETRAAVNARAEAS